MSFNDFEIMYIEVLKIKGYFVKINKCDVPVPTGKNRILYLYIYMGTISLLDLENYELMNQIYQCIASSMESFITDFKVNNLNKNFFFNLFKNKILTVPQINCQQINKFS